MKNPSPGSRFGGFRRPGDGTVPMGAALTTMMRRTPVAFIASTIDRVPTHRRLELSSGPQPRLFGGQAEGCAPVASAFAAERVVAPVVTDSQYSSLAIGARGRRALRRLL